LSYFETRHPCCGVVITVTFRVPPSVGTSATTELVVDSTVAVRLDLGPDRPELPGWARAHGLEPTERTVFMTCGDLTPRGIPEHRYTPISVAMA